MDKALAQALDKVLKMDRQVFIDPVLALKHQDLGYTALRLRSGNISEHGELEHDIFLGKDASVSAVRRSTIPNTFHPVIWSSLDLAVIIGESRRFRR